MAWRHADYPGKRYRFDKYDFATVDLRTRYRNNGVWLAEHRCLVRITSVRDQAMLDYVVDIVCPVHRLLMRQVARQMGVAEQWKNLNFIFQETALEPWPER